MWLQAHDPTNGFWHDCTGSNPMSERNYPCDNQIITYYGAGQDLDAVGEAVFKKQLYQCTLAQARLPSTWGALPMRCIGATSYALYGPPFLCLYWCHVLCFVWPPLLMLCMGHTSYALYGSHVLCFVWVPRPMLCIGATSYALYGCHVLCFAWLQCIDLVSHGVFPLTSMHPMVWMRAMD